MKSKNFLSTAIVAIFLSMSLISCEKEEIVSPTSLPGEIKSYVATHFPEHEIIQATEDKELFHKTYEVILDGSISLEFNRNKKIVEINGVAELPESVIPAKIEEYVEVNYAENVITDWEIDDQNQQIGLDNGLELEFSMSGDFLRIDG